VGKGSFKAVVFAAARGVAAAVRLLAILAFMPRFSVRSAVQSDPLL
jgi:hypothetical protein